MEQPSTIHIESMQRDSFSFVYFLNVSDSYWCHHAFSPLSRAKLQRVPLPLLTFVWRRGLRPDAGGVLCLPGVPQRGGHVCGAGRPTVSPRQASYWRGNIMPTYDVYWIPGLWALWSPSNDLDRNEPLIFILNCRRIQFEAWLDYLFLAE